MADALRVIEILRQAKQLAKEYYALTGRPLGVTGEIAEYEAVRLLGLELSPVRHPGYDAIRRKGQEIERLQIKGRCILPGSKPGQRIGRIDLSKPFDAVLLVLLSEDFEATEIQRGDLRRCLCCPYGPRLQVAQRARGVGSVEV